MKKIGKSIMALLLILAMTIMAAACQSKEEPAGTDADQPEVTEGEPGTDTGQESEETGREAEETDKEAEETDQAPGQLEKISFALDWTPNTNHSGLYLAAQQGFYAEEGLEVEFQESDMNFIEMVATESAPFGIASQEQVLQARASSAQIPIVAVAAIIQHNTSGFASPVDRSIKSPADFEGMTYSGWGTELELAFIETLMDKVNADYSKVEIINQSASNFIASMEMEADFAWIYWGWDGVNTELQDYPIDFILLQDIDPRLDFYSPVIITNETVINENPELIERFLRATAKGYELAIEEPELAVGAIMEAAPELDAELLLASQIWLNDKYIDDAVRWGEMDPEIWSSFKDWMLEHDTLESDPDTSQAFTNDYLP